MSLKKLVLFLSLFSFTASSAILDSQSIQLADGVPFDNSTNGFVSEDVQAAIEEVSDAVTVSASPGFTWGKSGNVSNSYLLNDSVPSNTAGRLVPVTTGVVTTVFVAAQTASTSTIEVRRRVGAVFTTIAICAMAGVRKITCTIGTPPAVVLNDELTVYVNGAAKNPVVGIIIKGSL